MNWAIFIEIAAASMKSTNKDIKAEHLSGPASQPASQPERSTNTYTAIAIKIAQLIPDTESSHITNYPVNGRRVDTKLFLFLLRHRHRR